MARALIFRPIGKVSQRLRDFADSADARRGVGQLQLVGAWARSFYDFGSALQVAERGLDPMTIRTSHFALADFTLNRRPGPPSVQHRCHVMKLVLQMIELQHDDVGFAAVHAGMRAEVSDHLFAVLVEPGRRVPI